MENLSNFSERLKDLMFEAEIKSDALAKAIGVAGSTVRSWCLGSQQIFLSNATKLADYFNCSLDLLMGLIDEDSTTAFLPRPQFYDRLREVMRQKGVTRYRITKNSSIKDSYFTTWKRGADPHMLCVIELAKFLDTSIDFLVGRKAYE